MGAGGGAGRRAQAQPQGGGGVPFEHPKAKGTQSPEAGGVLRQALRCPCRSNCARNSHHFYASTLCKSERAKFGVVNFGRVGWTVLGSRRSVSPDLRWAHRMAFRHESVWRRRSSSWRTSAGHRRGKRFEVGRFFGNWHGPDGSGIACTPCLFLLLQTIEENQQCL
jgi:hypothetical protein